MAPVPIIVGLMVSAALFLIAGPMLSTVFLALGLLWTLAFVCLAPTRALRSVLRGEGVTVAGIGDASFLIAQVNFWFFLAGFALIVLLLGQVAPALILLGGGALLESYGEYWRRWGWRRTAHGEGIIWREQRLHLRRNRRLASELGDRLRAGAPSG